MPYDYFGNRRNQGGSNQELGSSLARFGSQSNRFGVGANPSAGRGPIPFAMQDMMFGSQDTGDSGLSGGLDPVSVPGAGAGEESLFSRIGGLEGIGTIAQGLGSIGQLYGAIKGIGLAKDQLNFSKKAFNTNLENQRQSYNTALEDRIRSRYHTEGRQPGAAKDYLNKHRL